MSNNVPRLAPRHGVAGATVDLDVPTRTRLGRSRVQSVAVDVVDLSITGALLRLHERKPLTLGHRVQFRRGNAEGVATIRHIGTETGSDEMLCGVSFVSLCPLMEKIVYDAIDQARGSSAAEYEWSLNR